MSDWTFFGISFAEPRWLLLLLLIPILSFLRGRIGNAPAILYSSTSILEKIGKRRLSRVGDFLTSLSYFTLASLIVALARPQLGQTVTRTHSSGVDIMLVLDVSRSMLAEDFTLGTKRANRFEAVRMVTEKFILSRPNDRIGIVAFAGRPYLVSPLTLDHNWLAYNLERLRIGLVEDGTAIGSAIASAANRLKDKPSKSKIMILLSDGDNNAGSIQPLTAAEAAKALGIRIYTIGAGSRGPVPYPFQDPFGRIFYRNVEMGFNETVLQQIASITGGKYFRATDTRSLEAIFNDIDRLEKTDVEIEKIALHHDLFGWFLLAGFSLLSLELLLSLTLWKRLP
ncbi:MAG: VWA domain-containing protein [Chthoniobacterales bacterium]|nr:VWA domain-containing protein [Chthoniobacterales bacterium]MCX7712090.1 VWA domain-containing protein [Chthoniobacterales bacterium]